VVAEVLREGGMRPDDKGAKKGVRSELMGKRMDKIRPYKETTGEPSACEVECERRCCGNSMTSPE
jgi:hypothetical protein